MFLHPREDLCQENMSESLNISHKKIWRSSTDFSVITSTSRIHLRFTLITQWLPLSTILNWLTAFLALITETWRISWMLLLLYCPRLKNLTWRNYTTTLTWRQRLRHLFLKSSTMPTPTRRIWRNRQSASQKFANSKLRRKTCLCDSYRPRKSR